MRFCCDISKQRGEMKLAVSAVKMRSANHERTIREMRIGVANAPALAPHKRGEIINLLPLM